MLILNLHSGLQTARDIFSEVGNTLKARRLNEFHDLVGCYLTDTILEDPALASTDLDRVLKENEAKSRKRFDEVFSILSYLVILC